MEQRPDFNILLREIFPRTSWQTIENVIEIVEESNYYDSFEQKVETMVNLLSGDGAQGPMPEIDIQQDTNRDILLRSLSTIHPHVDQNSLKQYLDGKPDNWTLEDALEDLTLSELPNKLRDPLVILEELKTALPNADPSYLHKKAQSLATLSHENLDYFVQNCVEKNDYPTMKDYLERKKVTDEISIYQDPFELSKYLEVVPNPMEKFYDVKNQLILNENASEVDEKYALNFLYNHYSYVRKRNIDMVYKWEKRNLVSVCDRLERLGKNLVRPRPLEEIVDNSENIPLLQLVTFLKYRKQIKQEIKNKDEKYRKMKEEARKYNLLWTCQCCYDDELIPEECFYCMKGCIFCQICMKKGVEVGIGKGDLRFPCFANCESEFSLSTLQFVLSTNTFNRLTQRIASDEIKKANIDGLETCPFCDFAMILPEDEKIFKCINSECMIESCRQCRHQSHVPLRCSEIEYDEDVRRRTFIENKMTEALTRTCYSCNKPFIKSSGCNKMTCNCGAKMCYLCGKAILDYNHFGDGRCPLISNDVEIHLHRVLKGAQQAKDELGNVEIKFDPTANIRQFYN